MFFSSKISRISLYLLTMSIFDGACQSSITPGVKRGPSFGADRDSFFESEANRETVSSEMIADDPGVRDLSNTLAKDPFSGCGYTSLEAGDEAVIQNTKLINAGSKVVSGSVTILGNGSLSLGGKQKAMVLNNVFSVVSTSPNNAKPTAVRMAQRMSESMNFESLSQVNVQTALDAKVEQPSCGVVMVRGQKSISADNETYVNVVYDKPIVQIINPLLSVERIKLQLIEPILITAVTAILDTNDSDIVDSGLTQKGQVEVSLIAPTRTLTDSVGSLIDIKSEVAYRVTNKFVGVNNRSNSPSILDQIVEYYISNQKVTHVILKTPRPEFPLVVYTAQ